MTKFEFASPPFRDKNLKGCTALCSVHGYRFSIFLLFLFVLYHLQSKWVVRPPLITGITDRRQHCSLIEIHFLTNSCVTACTACASDAGRNCITPPVSSELMMDRYGHRHLLTLAWPQCRHLFTIPAPQEWETRHLDSARSANKHDAEMALSDQVFSHLFIDPFIIFLWIWLCRPWHWPLLTLTAWSRVSLTPTWSWTVSWGENSRS